MSYSVELTKWASSKIAGWRLSSHLQREILRGLDELARDPNRSLVRVGSPVQSLEYDIVVREAGEPSSDHIFTLTLRFGTDEETLFVVDCGHYNEDRPR